MCICGDWRSRQWRSHTLAAKRTNILHKSFKRADGNVMNGVLGHFFARIGKLGHESLLRMVRWMRWHCPRDTGSKFEPWRSETEHATSQSRGLPIILNICEWAEKKHFVWLNPWSPTFQAGSFNHYTRAPMHEGIRQNHSLNYFIVKRHSKIFYCHAGCNMSGLTVPRNPSIY